VSTRFFTAAPDAFGAKMVAIATAKTAPCMAAAGAGWATALVKGVLCNWMVSLGTEIVARVALGVGTSLAARMPIMAFIAMGFEHCVVNVFAVPVASCQADR
jgi:formate/nitrite transporter FocA (FNT family)